MGSHQEKPHTTTDLTKLPASGPTERGAVLMIGLVVLGILLTLLLWAREHW